MLKTLESMYDSVIEFLEKAIRNVIGPLCTVALVMDMIMDVVIRRNDINFQYLIPINFLMLLVLFYRNKR